MNIAEQQQHKKAVKKQQNPRRLSLIDEEEEDGISSESEYLSDGSRYEPTASDYDEEEAEEEEEWTGKLHSKKAKSARKKASPRSAPGKHAIPAKNQTSSSSTRKKENSQAKQANQQKVKEVVASIVHAVNGGGNKKINGKAKASPPPQGKKRSATEISPSPERGSELEEGEIADEEKKPTYEASFDFHDPKRALREVGGENAQFCEDQFHLGDDKIYSQVANVWFRKGNEEFPSKNFVLTRKGEDGKNFHFYLRTKYMRPLRDSLDVILGDKETPAAAE